MGGATWAAIAAEVGFTKGSNARRAVLAHFGEVPAPDRDASRALWRERVELLWEQAYRDVLAGRPGAVRAATAVASTRLHHLRHLSASMLLAACVPTDLVSKRLGYSSIQVTVDTYGRLINGADATAAAASAALVPQHLEPTA